MNKLSSKNRKPHLYGAFLSLVVLFNNVGAAEFAVSAAHPLASRAGIEVLLNGGNAFDAAIAITSTLAVVEPYSSGIGGGGFYLLHQAENNHQVMLDARERAPLLAGRDFYIDSKGEVNSDWSRNGAKSAGIPGIPAALDYLQKNYGRLPLEKTMSRAIQYAEEGFEVERIYKRMAEFRQDVIRRFPDSREILLVNDQVPELGTLIVQKDLAKTLKLIADKGRSGFYQGEVADKLVASVRKHDGIWSHQDLQQYQVIEREPVRFTYRGAEITAASLPSSGGIVLASIFNMLDQLDYEHADELQKHHILTEAMRRAYRDRAQYLGDSDYYEVPVNRLINSEHATGLLENYSANKATDSNSLGSIIDTNASTDTTHFSVVDSEGNRVSATLSINWPFGSCLIAEGTGVLLNDEMDDFSARPGVPNAYGLLGSEANSIAPGKRMLSSMTPAFVEEGDRVLVSGTPGGSRIITMQLLGILEFLEGKDVTAIVSRPRFHHQFYPDHIYHEDNALSDELKQHLTEKGHILKLSSRRYGNMQAVIINKKGGQLDAASDPRGLGSSIIVHE
ncbi:MAG: gamma-glutamyltranspeptidase/glutathione hydrolase [Gammaproteobacteria bacterium]|jgi:gamma-glutamyltranspeptidase/glutathione hydrolase